MTVQVARWYKARDLFEKIAINAIAWCGVIYFIYLALFAAPANFPNGAYIKVESGGSLQKIADDFQDRGVVNSGFLFESLIRLLGSDRSVKAGTYYFSGKQNVFWVAARLIGGDFETTPVKVTVIEGMTDADIAKLLLDKVPEFQPQPFIAGAREGYMFPDTYYFRPGDDTATILGIFANNFRVHVQKIGPQISDSKRSEEDIVIMASLLEKEASNNEDRRVIAGILWHRIAIGMPLQVDAVFPYIIGKNSFTLTKSDLKIDSLYNTYKYKGLPVGPIANPGLDAILDAATPTKTSYLYYLSDKNGTFHYATTYAQHLANREKYFGQ